MHRPTLCAFLPALLIACSDQGINRIDDDAEGAGDRVLQVLPELIEFGEVAAGEVVVDSFTVTSIGTGTVSLEPLHIHGSGTFTIVGDPLPETLAPGASFEVEVAYEPATSDDHADVLIESDAGVPRINVELSGVGVMPDLVFDPPLVELRSYDGNTVYGSFIARNEGVVDLVVDSWVLQGESFEIETDLPGTLGPGEETVVDVTWYPQVEGTELGYFWVASNDPDGNELATIEGFFQLPCLGLHEAVTRGWADLRSTYHGIEVTHQGEDLDICIDRWYLYISDQTQDAGAGDPAYVESHVYGEEGSVVLEQGESVTFTYATAGSPAWWCVEQTQVTDTAEIFHFTGAQVPPMLLDTMLGGGFDPQTEVWGDIQDNPVFVVGRERGWTTTVAGGTTFIEIEVVNIGRAEGSGVVYETIPAGMTASSWSDEPIEVVEDDEGATTYAFAVALDAAKDTEQDVQTIYDSQTISYVLELDERACTARSRIPEPVVQWADASGYTRQALGSPFIIECW
jgi:hypothetical protein